MARKQPTPMRKALDELYEIQSGSGLATPKQLLETAEKYEVEVWKLEGLYLDAAETLMREDMAWEPISF